MKSSISVIYPAYNEEANIETSIRLAIEMLNHIAGEYEVIPVNDGSQDRTGVIIEQLAREHPRIRPLHHPHNRGYARALKSGFEAARYDLVFYTDSDLQFDLWDIKKLLALIPDADIVVGYRLDRKDSLLRIIGAWGFNLLVRTMFNINVRDIDCAFKLFRRHVFDKIHVESEQFMVDAEILAKAQSFGFRVREVGVSHFPRAGGHSTVRLKHILLTLNGTWKLKRQLCRQS